MNRNCPNCLREIKYSDKYKLQRAIDENSLCMSCANRKKMIGNIPWNKGKIIIPIFEQKRKIKEYQKKYALSEHGKRINLNKKLRSRYGISLDEYNDMVKKQDGLCAICKNKPSKLCVDHNHVTNNVRQLLCRNCNLGIGYFKDNVSYLENAISYIKESK